MLPALPSASDPLKRYLAEVRSQALLTPDEERGLARAYHEEGDAEAGQRLVAAHLRLVVKVAMQYHRQWSNLLDLIQEGNLGLLEALRRFDPSRGVPFSGYATWWIRAMILRFLLENFGAVKFGNTRAGRKLFFQLQKERERLLQAGIEPTTRLLADRLGVTTEEVDRVDVARTPALSLDAPVGFDDDRRVGDRLPSEGADPEQVAANLQADDRVRQSLDAFAATLDDERERQIWARHTIAAEPASLSELGREFGVSKERIRQVEARMLKRLKQHLQRDLGDEAALLAG